MMNVNAIIDQITAHAAREFPNEACGLILLDGGNYSLLPCVNQSHQPRQSFLIDPLLFARHAHHVAAVYHSHPNRGAQPSEADIVSAERCNVPFLILSYPSGDIHTYTPTGSFVQPYEGRPFVYGVSDCLTLVCDYYRREFGIVIDESERKQWGWWLNADNALAFVSGWMRQGFEVVADLQPGDIIIMQLQGCCPNHAAVYLGDSMILHHASAGNLSRAEMYGHYWRKNTICNLRYVRPDCAE